MVVRIANQIISEIETASLYRSTLHVTNPVHDEDVFTDRWPETVSQQNEHADFLKELVRGLSSIQRGEMDPEGMMDWMRQHFGQLVVTAAADRIAQQVGGAVQDSRQRYTRRGGILLPTPGIIAGAGAAASRAAAEPKPHTFFGKKI